MLGQVDAQHGFRTQHDAASLGIEAMLPAVIVKLLYRSADNVGEH